MQGKACHRSSVTGTNQNLIKTNRIVSLQDQKFPLSKTQIPKCLVQMTARLQFTLSNNRLQPRAHLPASAVGDQRREPWRTIKDKKNTVYMVHFTLPSPRRRWWATVRRTKTLSGCFSGALLWFSVFGKAQKLVSKLAKYFILHSEHWTPTKICKVQMEFTKHISRATHALISDF